MTEHFGVSVEVYEPERWFAWRPVRTRDEGWTWWTHVWRERWKPYVGSGFWVYHKQVPRP